MMVRVLIASLATSVACGDVSVSLFDDIGSTAVAGFDPRLSNCATANSGPLAKAGETREGSPYGVFTEGGFVMTANGDGTVRSYRFAEGRFTARSTAMQLGWVEGLWAQSGLVFAGAPGTGLHVIDLAADGTLSLIDSITSEEVEQARQIWFDGQRVFTPSGSTGLFAHELQGGELASIGQPLNGIGFSPAVMGFDNTLFLVGQGGLRALTFNASVFTTVVHDPALTGERIWVDDDDLFIGQSDGIVHASFDGGAFRVLSRVSTRGRVRGIWSDGVHVFAVSETDGLFVYAREPEGLTPVAEASGLGECLGVYGDGQFVYVGAKAPGTLHAFSGFSCTAIQ